MKKSVSFTLYARQQPTWEAWEKAKELVETWNSAHALKWVMRGAREYSIYSIMFDNPDASDVGKLESMLNEYEVQYHIDVKRRINKTYDEQDYQQADMVLLYGFELHGLVADRRIASDKHKQFVTNLAENWTPGTECPGCGWTNPVYGQQLGLFVIDEFFLDREYNDDTGKWERVEHGWDMLSIPGDVILVSDRVLKTFQDQGVRGYHTLEVLSQSTGKPSRCMFQLLPNHWIEKVCEEHSDITGDACPVCGRVLGEMRGEMHLRQEWVGSDEIIGRKPGPRLIYYAQRVYQMLVSIRTKGLIRSVPLYICEHSR